MNKMTIEDFDKQAEHCKKVMPDGGPDCGSCPGENQICADNILNICGKLKEREQKHMIKPGDMLVFVDSNNKILVGANADFACNSIRDDLSNGPVE